MNSALRGSRNHTLKQFLPDVEEKKRPFDAELQDGDTLMPTMVKCHDGEQEQCL